MEANQELTATLAAVEWNVVLSALQEAPYRVAAPVIQKLAGQLNAPPDMPPPAHKVNGEDLHATDR